ncbi:MAG: hypothetical protein ACU0AT_05185 [Tranquillimonas sp.]
MKVDAMIRLILRQLLRRMLGRGMTAGLKRMQAGGAARDGLTPQQRRQAQQARQTARRARQAAHITRRLGR